MPYRVLSPLCVNFNPFVWLRNVSYDETVDILTIRLREGDYDESDEVVEGIIVDFDKQGKPMAIEILNAKALLGQIDRVMLEYARVPQAA